MVLHHLKALRLTEFIVESVRIRQKKDLMLILSEKEWGFIDFELSERNVRIFDPCYAATAILSESFAEGDAQKLIKWVDIYKNIIYGFFPKKKFFCLRQRRDQHNAESPTIHLSRQ